MRSLIRQKQSVYWSRITEELDGIDTNQKYQNPELHRFSVSATAGTSEELASGYVPEYDRYITCFDRNFNPQESDVFWIDKIPEINEDGSLVLDESGKPTVPPDYVLVKIINSQKSNVARYGISKIGSENG